MRKPEYGCDKFDNIQQLIRNRANKTPDAIAYKYMENKVQKQLTFKEHYENVLALGSALTHDMGHDNHIAMLGENCYEWILTQAVVWGSDNVFVPIDKELPLADLLNVINHSDTNIVFCTGAFAKCLSENRNKIPNVKAFFVYRPKEELSEGFTDAWEFSEKGRKMYSEGYTGYTDIVPDEYGICEIVYTSGTTGAPKGVMLSRHNIYSSIYYGMHSMTVLDVGLSVLPYNHTYESTCNLQVALHKGSTLCINESLRTVADNFKKYQPKYVFLVPLFVETFYKKIQKTLEKQGKLNTVNRLIKISNGLRKVGIDLRSVFFKQLLEVFGGKLEFIVCGGAPIRPELAVFFDGIGINLINGYGITECSPLVSVNMIDDNDFKSVGYPLGCVEIRIDDPNEEGEGEILVKGDIVMMGYYKNEEATKEVLSEDGWFATGDYGKIVDNRLYITGRKKNLIVLTNGKNIYPEEIEDYISAIDEVEEHMVYANKDENGHEVSLAAMIYPDKSFAKGKTDEELVKFFKEKCNEVCKPLPSYKQIATIVIRHEEFPKTTTKKIKRQEVLKTL